MKLIKAIVRPEKTMDIINVLYDAGFPAVTKMDVSGRGRQNAPKGSGTFDELPKDLLYIVCEDKDKKTIIDIIMEKARTGEHGDGRIFVSDIESAYTISTGKEEL